MTAARQHLVVGGTDNDAAGVFTQVVAVRLPLGC